MCGILAHFSAKEIPPNDVDYSNIDIPTYISDYLARTTSSEAWNEDEEIFQSLIPKIISRGSDFASYTRPTDNIELFSSVLSLRSPFTSQPIANSAYVLQFNGELYNKEIDGNGHANDTAFIFQRLNQTGDVLKTIGELEGEFSYCIFDVRDNKIYFGKDILGKKSLSYSAVVGEIYVSSCMPSGEAKSNFQECLNATVYIADLSTFNLETIHYADDTRLPAIYTVNDIAFDTNEQGHLQKLKTTLASSVESRIKNIFPLHESASDFGILFSGGLDCTLLASLAASLSEPGTKIDLLNVSFFNPRTQTDPSATPDRKLSLKSWQNLYSMFHKQGVAFRMVEIDVSFEEYTKHRQRVIDLIYPNDTEMDLSIAIAFYFASRGIGNKLVYEADHDFKTMKRVPYESQCKVLLSGLGADELFGGYTRHERIFTYISNDRRRELKAMEPKHGEHNLESLYTDLRNELQADLSNLHVRNLARDDKLICSWSKELRYPFLDTNFIYFVANEVPLMSKLHYDAESGSITRKHLLRLLAQDLGMDWVAQEPKRAIQFGAKSAKMESGTGKMKGTDKVGSRVNSTN